MRWLFYFLCTVNLVMLVVQWSEQRSLVRLDQYRELDSAIELALIGVDERAAQELKGCTLMGPYENRKVAEKYEAALLDGEVKSQVIHKKVELAPAYWVYFDDFSLGLTPREQRREFVAKGVDSFIILEGDLKGFISVGVFKNIDSARRMIKIMLKKGYQTKMAEFKRANDEFWLQVSMRYSLENKKKIETILTAENSVIEMRQIFCK